MAKWFGAHYSQGVRFSSAVKYKKGPLVLTSLLNQTSKSKLLLLLLLLLYGAMHLSPRSLILDGKYKVGKNLITYLRK